MNAKLFLTIAGVVGIIYGAFFLFLTGMATEIYGLVDQSTELSTRLQKFFGGAILGFGIVALLGRNAHESIGRKAIFGGMGLYFFITAILIALWVFDGGPTVSYFDLLVTIVLGAGSAYFYSKEKV